MAKSIKLSSGYDCPTLGLGTALAHDPAKCMEAIKAAVKAGYRHIDTAFIYGNESLIGQALSELFAEGVVKREEMFITTKLSFKHHEPQHVVPCLKKQLEALKLSYVDLYLMHSPIAVKHSEEPGFLFDETGTLLLNTTTTLEETWGAMEECVKQGLAHSIGISNFNEKQVDRILKVAHFKPVTNQIELHPYFQNKALASFCRDKGVPLTAYGPLGSAGSGKFQKSLLDDERLVKIAQKHGKSTAQVALRWQIQQGNITIPKSETPSRLVHNADIWDFELTSDDLAVIDTMETNHRCFTFAGFKGIEKHPELPYPDCA